MNNFKVLMNGIVKENPTFVLLLGMCPTLGTTSSAINGMGMGLATMFVLICSNVVISSIKNLIPDMVRIPAFIVVIASFVTLLQMIMPMVDRVLWQFLAVQSWILGMKLNLQVSKTISKNNIPGLKFIMMW